jgi:hypothetical protein
VAADGRLGPRRTILKCGQGGVHVLRSAARLCSCGYVPAGAWARNSFSAMPSKARSSAHKKEAKTHVSKRGSGIRLSEGGKWLKRLVDLLR